MIESLRMIGQWNFSRAGYESPRELVIKGSLEDLDKFIASRVQEVKDGQIIVLILDPANQTLKAVPRDISRDELVRLSFIGHRKGNIPQDVLTVSSINYLTGEIKEKGKEREPSVLTLIRNLRDRLRRIEEDVFEAIWEDKVVNGVKFGEVLETLRGVFGDKRFRDWFRDVVSTNEIVTGCKKNCVYTLAVKLENGEVVELATTRPYKRYLLATEIYPIISPRINIVNGYCYVCNQRRMVLTEPIFPQASLLKIYTLDKISFVQGLAGDSKGKMRNFSICPECNFLIVDGLRYVEKEYIVEKIVRLGRREWANLYIIPTVSNKKVRVDYSQLKMGVKGLFTWRDWEEFQGFVEDLDNTLKGLTGNMYYLHLIFGKAGKSDFKYLGAILDTPAINLLKLGETLIDIGGLPSTVIPGLDDLLRGFPVLTLNNILRDPVSNEVNIRDFLGILRALMIVEPVEDQYIYILATKTAKRLRFGVNWSKTPFAEKNFVDTILRYLFLLKIIYKLNGYDSISVMTPDTSHSASPSNQVLDEVLASLKDQGMVDFIRFLGLDAPKAALFLLGVLVARIGKAQYDKGDTRKAVLNKLKYPGMDKYDVLDLANYIPFGLRHYRIFDDNEALYSAAKRLLDLSINDLGTPEENLFYILSGYAYQSYRIILGGGGGKKGGGEGG